MWFVLSALAVEVPDVGAEVGRVRPARKDVALVIGNEDYAGLPDAPRAQSDAELFSIVLTRVVGLPGENVSLERDASTERLTGAVMRVAARARKGGTLWVYYAGHGAGGDRGQRLLLGADASADPSAVSGVSLSWLAATLAASEASRVVVVLDAGFGGVGRAGEELYPEKRFVIADEGPPADPRVTLWLGASGAEPAGLFVEAGHGVFTWSVAGALRGWADGRAGSTADRVVQLGEAEEYVARLVRQLAGTAQRPSRDARPALAEWALSRVAEAAPDPGVLEVLAQAARAERVRVQQEALYRRAAADWAGVVAQVRAAPQPVLPGSAAEALLRGFLARHDGATVLVDGQELAVVVPETIDARAQLDVIARAVPPSTRKASRKPRKERVAAAPPPPPSVCGDLAALEGPAAAGQLDLAAVACLEERIGNEPLQTRRDALSRVLLVNADARGDDVEWARLAARHLETIDRSDPDLCLKYAILLARGDIEDAPEVLRWAEIGLENKARWVGETHVHRVYLLYRVRAEAASRLWTALERERLEDPSAVGVEEVELRRGQAKDYAREWLDYAQSSRQPMERPLALCRSAAGTALFCEG